MSGVWNGLPVAALTLLTVAACSSSQGGSSRDAAADAHHQTSDAGSRTDAPNHTISCSCTWSSPSFYLNGPAVGMTVPSGSGGLPACIASAPNKSFCELSDVALTVTDNCGAPIDIFAGKGPGDTGVVDDGGDASSPKLSPCAAADAATLPCALAPGSTAGLAVAELDGATLVFGGETYWVSAIAAHCGP